MNKCISSGRVYDFTKSKESPSEVPPKHLLSHLQAHCKPLTKYEGC